MVEPEGAQVELTAVLKADGFPSLLCDMEVDFDFESLRSRRDEP